MDDQVLKHYGLKEPFADSWSSVDQDAAINVHSTTETDALGSGQLVSKILYDRGIIKTDDGAPPKYCLDSKSFDARAYIRNVHRKATQNDLLRGQQYLESNVELKASSLKDLVESNFDRFVSSKRVIDNVNTKIYENFGRSSRSTESRLDMVKSTLNDTSVRATQIFEPVLQRYRKAESLRETVNIVEQYSAQFNLPSLLLRHIEDNDNEALLREYRKGIGLFSELRKRTSPEQTASERKTARLLGRVWKEVEKIMEVRKAYIWHCLEGQKSLDNELTARMANFLLEIGVDRNPYFEAYMQRLARIEKAITSTFTQAGLRIEILRRELLLQHNATRTDRLKVLSIYIQSETTPSDGISNIVETPELLGFWSTIEHLIEHLWTKPVASIAASWEIFQNMTDARSIKLLPNGPDGKSRRYHTFSEQERAAAVKKVEEVVESLCNALADFFVLRPSVAIPVDNDHQEVPDIGDREAGEFSFLPAGINSLATCDHLSSFMTAIMSGISRLQMLKSSTTANDSLTKLSVVVRERFIRAICELWQADSGDLPYLEDWNKASTGEGTEFPKTFLIVQKAIIHGISRIMFRNELMPLPSPRLLGNVRQQFVKNVYEITNGLMTLSYSTTEDEVQIESRKLLTTVNFTVIQSSQLLQLVQILESTFAISLTADLQKVNSMFTQYIQKLRTSFLAPRLSILETTIGRDIQSTEWLSVAFPQDVSLWTNECVLECVTTHALLSTRAPSLLDSFLEQMIHHIFTSVELCITPVNEISGAGILQLTLDLEFLSLQFGEAMPESAKSKLGKIFSLVDAKGRNSRVDASEKGEIKRMLARAARRWSVQANVFRGPLIAAPTRR